jgi:hypothetical protein
MSPLTGISGTIDHRCTVKIMCCGNWSEHPRLWTLLVGDPSRNKSPFIYHATWPPEPYQNDPRRSYEAALRHYLAAKKGKDDSVEEPDPQVRYVVWDTTVEKLIEIPYGATAACWSSATNSPSGSEERKNTAAAHAAPEPTAAFGCKLATAARIRGASDAVRPMSAICRSACLAAFNLRS